MAIVNLTPDSFYAASRVVDEAGLEARLRQVADEGASIVDIGGYSSRPGAADISIDEEWRRVELGLKILQSLSLDIGVSVDTFRSEIAERALALNDRVIVNDITAGEADPRIVDVVAEAGAVFVAMHMRGTPATMQSLTDYEDVVTDVVEALRVKAELLLDRGISPERLILDPGFGFAKTAEQNFRLLAHLDKVCVLGFSVLAGVSRKSMIYRTLDITPEESLAGTTALNWEALRQGATILRVHDVREAVQTVRLYNTFEQNR
jgi:dihydropteroate synthase